MVRTKKGKIFNLGNPVNSNNTGSPVNSIRRQLNNNTGSPVNNNTGSPVNNNTGSPVNKPGSPLNKPGSPLNKPGSPVNKPGSPVNNNTRSPLNNRGSPKKLGNSENLVINNPNSAILNNLGNAENLVNNHNSINVNNLENTGTIKNSSTAKKNTKKRVVSNNLEQNNSQELNINNINNINVNNPKNKVKSHNIVLKEVIKRMLESIHVIKLYHWNTKSYATHKATDGLHEKLGELVDHYVEVFIGKIDAKLKMTDYKELTIKNLTSNNEMETFILELIDFLMSVHTKLDVNRDTDLLNIRDEIVGELNQFLYLLRLS